MSNVWESKAYLYDSLVTNTKYGPLKRFLTREQELLDELVVEQERIHGTVTLLEVGSGTGRNLFHYVNHPHLLRHMAYLIGIDNSRAMATLARLKRIEHLEHGTLDDATAKKFLFVFMAGRRLSDYFCAGRVLAGKLTDEVFNGDTGALDGSSYDKSGKVVCCLLNTLGVMKGRGPREVLRAMVKALGPADILAISVFDACAFQREAPPLYGHLNRLVGSVQDRSFDYQMREFRTETYFSHWFDKQGIAEQLRSLDCQVADLSRIGDWGFFVTARRSPSHEVVAPPRKMR